MLTFLKLFVYPFLTIQLNSSMPLKLPKRFIAFSFVGISGIIVNSAILYYAKEFLYVPIPIASLIAIQIAIFNNFFWNHRFTRKRPEEDTWYSRQDPDPRDRVAVSI